MNNKTEIIDSIWELTRKKGDLMEEHTALLESTSRIYNLYNFPRGLTLHLCGGPYGDLFRDASSYKKWKNSLFDKLNYKLATDFSYAFPVRYAKMILQGCVPPHGVINLPHLAIDFYGVCDAVMVKDGVAHMHLYDPYDEITIEDRLEYIDGNVYDFVNKMVLVTAVVHTDSKLSIEVEDEMIIELDSIDEDEYEEF